MDTCCEEKYRYARANIQKVLVANYIFYKTSLRQCKLSLGCCLQIFLQRKQLNCIEPGSSPGSIQKKQAPTQKKQCRTIMRQFLMSTKMGDTMDVLVDNFLNFFRIGRAIFYILDDKEGNLRKRAAQQTYYHELNDLQRKAFERNV